GADADHGADGAGDDDGERADQQRDARAEDEAAEIVAAELVGAERVLPTALCLPDRRDQAMRQVLIVGIVRRDERCGERDGDDRGKYRAAEDEAAVAEAAAQEAAAPSRRC